MLQVREQEVLAGPQIAHGRSRCVWAGTQLVDHLREGDNDRDTQTRKIQINKTIKCKTEGATVLHLSLQRLRMKSTW